MNKEEIIEEFKSGIPKSDERMQEQGESESYLFGYKHMQGDQIHTVTDWGNIEKFLVKALTSNTAELKKIIEGKRKSYTPYLDKNMPMNEDVDAYNQALDDIIKELNHQ